MFYFNQLYATQGRNEMTLSHSNQASLHSKQKLDVSDENNCYYEFMSPIRHNKYRSYSFTSSSKLHFGKRIIEAKLWYDQSLIHVLYFILHPGRSPVGLKLLSSLWQNTYQKQPNNLQNQRFICVHGFQKFYYIMAGRAYK